MQFQLEDNTDDKDYEGKISRWAIIEECRTDSSLKYAEIDDPTWDSVIEFITEGVE